METLPGHCGAWLCVSSKQYVCEGQKSKAKVQMGLHRDGQRWNLPEELVEERR
jgi:hypothetical protein